MVLKKIKGKHNTAQARISLSTSKASVTMRIWDLESIDTTLARLAKISELWIASKENTSINNNTTAQSKLPEKTMTPFSPSIFNFLDTPSDDKDDDDLLRTLNKAEKEYYLTLNGDERNELLQIHEDIKRNVNVKVPNKFRVLKARLPNELKAKILWKLDRQNDEHCSGDNLKYHTWLETLLSIPHGQILVPQPNLRILDLMSMAKEKLNKTVYGHFTAKNAILQRLYQWLVNPLSPQRPLGLVGVPGNGKTSLIKYGLASVMGRPFNFTSLGGSTDSCTLLGHAYTYEGSTPGIIVEHLIQAQCINPIFYFDELDKISATQKGEEVVNSLIHLIDPVQNDKWKDRYIGNLDINVNYAMFVFSFNSVQAISPILLDRLQIVVTDEFDFEEQARIASIHLLPDICNDLKVNQDKIQVHIDALQELSRKIGKGGMRQIRAVLEQAISKSHMWIEIADLDLLLPLTPKDYQKIDAEKYIIVAGLTKLVDSCLNENGLKTSMYM